MVEWRVTPGLTDYEEAVRVMEQRAEDIAAGRADELLWFVEHPPLYTAGTSAKRKDLISADRFPVYDTKRGGQYTYHGPGQRVVYVMLNLNERGRDVRCFVRQLEKWVIDTLDQFNITGFIRDGRVGVWVERPDKPKTITNKTAEDKIAAIGADVGRWRLNHALARMLRSASLGVSSSPRTTGDFPLRWPRN